MTPPKKLSAPAAQTVNLKLTAKTPRAKKVRATPQERAQKRAQQMRERIVKMSVRFTDWKAKVLARITAAEDRLATRTDRLATRATKLEKFAATDPMEAKKARAKEAAAKRAAKLELKLAELRKVIES